MFPVSHHFKSVAITIIVPEYRVPEWITSKQPIITGYEKSVSPFFQPEKCDRKITNKHLVEMLSMETIWAEHEFELSIVVVNYRNSWMQVPILITKDINNILIHSRKFITQWKKSWGISKYFEKYLKNQMIICTVKKADRQIERAAPLIWQSVFSVIRDALRTSNTFAMRFHHIVCYRFNRSNSDGGTGRDERSWPPSNSPSGAVMYLPPWN